MLRITELKLPLDHAPDALRPAICQRLGIANDDLLDSVRRFVRERLVPAENEVSETDEIPESIVQEMRNLGLFGMTIPEKFGGLELTMEEECRVLFELCQTAPAFRSIIGTTVGIGSQGILMDGTPEQQAQWLPKLATGEVIPNAELTYRPYAPRSYAYLSDTNYSAKAAGLCRGVDLMYHEATYAAAEQRSARDRGHSTTTDAAKAALKAGARRLVIGHYSSRYKDETPLVEEARTLFAESYPATEGTTYTIEKQR